MHTLNLWDNNIPYYVKEYDQIPHMDVYIKENARGTILVCPGGGYENLAVDHEGVDIANWANGIGYNAFVLKYRVKPYSYPAILADGLRAMRMIRAKASEYDLDPTKIGVLGFSAGGHMVSTISTHYMDEVDKVGDEIDAFSARPDFSVLCYAVMSFTDKIATEKGTRYNYLLGNEKLYNDFSAEININENTPPAFIWHTAEDAVVNFNNSILYAQALGKYNIPFQLQIYPFGRHGIGLGKDNELASDWSDSCEKFINVITR